MAIGEIDTEQPLAVAVRVDSIAADGDGVLCTLLAVDRLMFFRKGQLAIMGIAARQAAVFVLAATLMSGVTAGQETAARQTFKPFRYKTVEGRQTTLADVRGKATLVVFFYPTCQYCNVALPEIQKLYEAHQANGLSTVWINVVPEQNRLIEKWRQQHNYTAPILLGGQAAQNDYALTMTPTHYLLDADGKVLLRQDGYKPGDEKELERHIQQALQPRP